MLRGKLATSSVKTAGRSWWDREGGEGAFTIAQLELYGRLLRARAWFMRTTNVCLAVAAATTSSTTSKWRRKSAIISQVWGLGPVLRVVAQLDKLASVGYEDRLVVVRRDKEGTRALLMRRWLEAGEEEMRTRKEGR